MKWNLEKIAEWTSGKIISRHLSEFDFIGTDTRSDLSKKIFVALKGDTYDAHDYLDQAVLKNAGLLLVHRLDQKFTDLKDQISIILVDDTLQALQQFAHRYRQSLATKIIGITGSNGKTTTKEFTAEILRCFKKTHYNQGSFNNHWGVPLTLLQIEADHEFAVIEMGMNHAGEIKRLVEIADPDVVVCTMVGTAHIEFFGTAKKIAEAKSEIYQDSRATTIRIFNQDQDLTFAMMYPVAKKYPASRMLSFSGVNDNADVYFKINQLTMRNIKISGIIAGVKGEATIPIFGKHNLVNLMAASTLAYACAMPPEKIWLALEKCKMVWGRNQFIQTVSGAEILFDGYNANPDSMGALLENIPLLQVAGKKIGIFGQMKELGSEAPEAHRQLGLKAGQAGFDHILFIGEDYEYFLAGLNQADFQNPAEVELEFKNEMGNRLQQILKNGDVVVIKGSRGAATERFIPFCDPINWNAK